MLEKIAKGENNMAKVNESLEGKEAPKTKKIQIIQTKRVVLEYEVPEEMETWGYRFWDSLKQHEEKTGVKIEPKMLGEKNLDAIYPVGGDDVLASQTLKENYLILAEFQRIWNEYPRESFNSTLHELARTIHEECSTDDYSSYLPEDFDEKYYENIGTEEEPDLQEKEDLWSERWDAEYDAIHKWIREMTNEELIIWLRRVIEFIGY
jgi:hypothetical protein